MKLPFAITAAQLRRVADPLTFARGEKYWRDGRVQSVAVVGEQVLASVRGTERYRVMLGMDGAQLAMQCSCPIGTGCKHAVAVLLACLEGGEAPAGAVPAPVLAAAPGPVRWPTRADVDAWAEEHRVTYALGLSAEGLLAKLPNDPWLRSGLARLSLREVASLEGARRHTGARGLSDRVMAVAAAALDAEAASVAAALAEEHAAPSAPSAPEAVALWAKLHELRAVVRAQAMPRSRAWRATAGWKLDARTATLTWQEPQRVYRTMPDWGTFSVTASLAFDGRGHAELACTCRTPHARCVHALALLDATLDRLADPDRPEDARALAAELLRPSWDRALRDLDLLDAAAAKPRAAIEVWWIVEELMGAVTLTPLVKKQARHGGCTAGARMSPARLVAEHADALPEADARIANELVAWAERAGSFPSRAFAAAVGHPRILGDDDDAAPMPVARVPLGFTALAADDQLLLEPMLDATRVPPRVLAELLRSAPAGEPLFLRDPARARFLLVDVSDEARALWGVLERHGPAFPPESHARLLERLGKLEQRVPIHVPQVIKGRELPAELVVVVRLRLLPDVTLELELFVRPGDGAPLYPPGAGPTDVLLTRHGERGYVRRQLATEQARARERLGRLPMGDAEEGPPGCFRLGDTEAALALVAALQAPPPGLEAQWIDVRPTVASSPVIDDVRVSIERKQDWFGIVGDVKHETGRMELAVLLDAARRQQRYVKTGDNQWTELSDALRAKLQPIADLSYARRDRTELSPGAVPAMRALMDAGAHVDVAPAWQQLTERLATAARLRPTVPAALDAVLRPYQIEGHAWLTRVAAWGAGAVLADDMGLGKTVQAIAMLIDRSKRGPALVLAPTSVAHNWASELAKFAPSLRPVMYAEAGDRAAMLAGLKKRDVVICSYGLLARDAEVLAATTFATLILDEAQAVKNPTTQRARGARRLDAEFRLAMSGTPLENHLGELWSLFAIVFPGLLGSQDQFRTRFATPIEKANDPDARAALGRVIRPFLLRRTKSEVATELPAKTEIQVPIALSPEEHALYEDARLAAIASLGGGIPGLRKNGGPAPDADKRFQVLAALTRLRLLASHPKLYDPSSTVASSKLRRLRELLDELRDAGHRALVFSQFTSHLALVRAELDAGGFTHQYLDGGTTAPQRAKRIAAFQAGEGDVFLISLQAGGTGINLTAADYVIHLDPWWNPAVEDQATDRAHRIGQDKPVTVYRLVARGTIEERILAMHGSKRALVGSILDGTDVAARLTTRDLLALLAGEANPGTV